MEHMPKAMFVVDTSKEDTAVKEAKRLRIPIIALIDTNSNPDLVDYPIPGNDDATKSIKAVANIITDTVIEGRKRFLSYLSQEGVKAKGSEAQEDEVVLLPEEEVKIKEIEEIVETAEPAEEEGKAAKKSHVKAADSKPKARRKV